MHHRDFEKVKVTDAGFGTHGAQVDRTVRLAALAADEQAQDHRSLAKLWEQLAARTLEIFDAFLTPQRCFLLVRHGPPRTVRPAELRGIAILQRVLVEGSQQAAATELGISPSTTAARGQAGLTALGFSCRVPRTPYIIVAAANASQGHAAIEARSSTIEAAHRPLQVLTIPRPEGHISSRLTGAVLQVTTSLLEGMTRSHIARVRNTSERTVSNQLSVAFKQLRAAGRLDMLRVLACAQYPHHNG